MAVRPVPTMYPSPAISSIGSSSVISSQIEMMTRKVEHVREELIQLATVSSDVVERKESDARDLLAHYHFVLTQLMLPASMRDPSLRYFDQDHSRIRVDQNPTQVEIEACRSLICEIETLSLDLSLAEDVISYRGAAYELEEVARKIEKLMEENKDFIFALKAPGSSSKVLSQEQCRKLRTTLLELAEKNRVVSDLLSDYIKGFINSFTSDAQDRFWLAARRANEIGLDLVLSISQTVSSKFSKSSGGSLSDQKTKLHEILMITYEIRSGYECNKNKLSSFAERASQLSERIPQRAKIPSEDAYSRCGAGAAVSHSSDLTRLEPPSFYEKQEKLAGFASAPVSDPSDTEPPDLRPVISLPDSYLESVASLSFSNQALRALAPSHMSVGIVDALERLGVCVVAQVEFNGGVGSAITAQTYPRALGGHHIRNRIGSLDGRPCQFLYTGPENPGVDQIISLGGAKVMGAMKALGRPIAVLFSYMPRKFQSALEPVKQLPAPKDLDRRIVNSFGQFGFDLVDPTQLAIPVNDVYVRDFGVESIVGDFDVEGRYQILSTPGPNPIDIIRALEQLFHGMKQSTAPAIALLTFS